MINFSAVQGIVLRHLYTWRNDLDRIVDSFWWTFLDLVFWGLTSKYLLQISLPMPQIIPFFIGGTIFWHFLIQAQRDMNMSLLDEAWDRNLINIFTTPLRLREFIIATLILGLIKLFLTIFLLCLVAYLLYQYNIYMYGWWLIPAVINLIMTGWWLGFIISGLILRFGYRVQSFAWALSYIIYPFSAVLYPVSILPSWAEFIARILPTSYIFESMRSILFSGSFSFLPIIIAVILNLCYLTLAIIFLKMMYDNALENGRLVKLS